MARVDPEGPATPVGPVVRVDLVARNPVDPVDPAGRVTVVDLGDMNRVAAATVDTAAAMDPADLASREVPAVRVGMTLEDPVDPEVPVGMNPADPVGPVDMILVDPAGRPWVPNPVVRVDPERLVVPNRVDPGSREATDLRMVRAPLGRIPARPVRMPMLLHLAAARLVRMPMLLHLTAAGPVPMPAPPHLTPVDRRRDPTTQAVATCQEATPAEATRAVATRAVATGTTSLAG